MNSKRYHRKIRLPKGRKKRALLVKRLWRKVEIADDLPETTWE